MLIDHPSIHVSPQLGRQGSVSEVDDAASTEHFENIQVRWGWVDGRVPPVVGTGVMDGLGARVAADWSG
jgi:hypothetical protein